MDAFFSPETIQPERIISPKGKSLATISAEKLFNQRKFVIFILPGYSYIFYFYNSCVSQDRKLDRQVHNLFTEN